MSQQHLNDLDSMDPLVDWVVEDVEPIFTEDIERLEREATDEGASRVGEGTSRAGEDTYEQVKVHIVQQLQFIWSTRMRMRMSTHLRMSILLGTRMCQCHILRHHVL